MRAEPPDGPPRRPAPAPRKLSLGGDEIPARSGHIPSLDGLRACSIGIVLLSHFVSDRLFPGGFGVTVFFVISGFLVTRLLLAEYKRNGRIDLPDFYARRVIRLYPVIIVYTLVAVSLVVLSRMPVNLLEPASALFYFANYYYSYLDLAGQRGGSMPFAIFWSLSVEEHFYATFPILLVAAIGGARRLVALSLIVVAAVLAARIATAWVRPDLLQSLVFYFQTQFRIDSLAVGVLLAVLCELPSRDAVLRMLTRPWLVAASLLAILACFTARDPWFRETVRYTVLSFAIMVLIANVVFSERYRFVNVLLNSRPATLVGRLSYSLYVWHLLVQLILGGVGFAASGMVQAPVGLALSFLLAAASYYGIERPCLTLRRRYGSGADDGSSAPRSGAVPAVLSRTGSRAR